MTQSPVAPRNGRAAEHNLPSTWRERFIDAGAMSLHAIEAGDPQAPLLLLLHGFPEFWFAWRRHIEPLATAGYHVVAIDQRGYNLSTKPSEVAEYKLVLLRNDIIHVLDALGAKRAYVMAHDWGGHVAWSVAEHHADRIERLVVLDAGHPVVMMRNFLTNPRQLLKSWYGIVLQIPWLPERILSVRGYARLRDAITWNGDEGPPSAEENHAYVAAWSRDGALSSMINWYRALGRTWPDLSKPRIQVPTLLLWGTRDQFLDRDVATESIALCNDGRVVYLDGTHWVHHERPALVREHALTFFAGKT